MFEILAIIELISISMGCENGASSAGKISGNGRDKLFTVIKVQSNRIGINGRGCRGWGSRKLNRRG